jgi:hypothetical protein
MSKLLDYLKENHVFEHPPISPPPYPELKAPCYMHADKKQNIDLSWWAITEPFTMVSDPYYHDYDQFLFFSGSGSTMDKFGGVVEFHLGDENGNMEKFIVTKPTTFYVKAGLYHCPLVFMEIYDPGNPIFFCDVSLAGTYRRYRKGSDQPLGYFEEPIEKTW